MTDGRLLLRFRNLTKEPAMLRGGGLAHGELTLPPGNDFQIASLAVGAVKSGPHDLAFGVVKGAGIELDGFALAEAAVAGQVSFAPTVFQWTPQILPGPVEQSRLLKYPDAQQHYGIAWSYGVFQVREILNKVVAMRKRV